MALNNSPTKKGKRQSLLDQFPDLAITSSSRPSGATLHCLSGSFSKGWPPAISEVFIASSMPKLSRRSRRDTSLSISVDYRNIGDNWRVDSTIKDEPLDVTELFESVSESMKEISNLLETRQATSEEMERAMIEELAKVVFGSNQIARIGLGLDETIKFCLTIFGGEIEFVWEDRSAEYQAKLDTYVSKSPKKGDNKAIRLRREVVQHAAALQYFVNSFVRLGKPITEGLLKETHRILTKDLDPADSGNFNTQTFGGISRQEGQNADAGAHRFTKPADIPKAMKSLVGNLQSDMDKIDATTTVDPFMFASNYCDRFVNIHPFKDGNGRMSRLLMRVLLLKYGGCVVLGEKGDERDKYIDIAQESAKFGSHAGQIGKLVLENAVRTLKRLKTTLSRGRNVLLVYFLCCLPRSFINGKH